MRRILAHAALFDVPLRLVVIDTLAKASIGADENAVKDMGIVMRNVERINEKTGAHVMLIHHLTVRYVVRGSTFGLRWRRSGSAAPSAMSRRSCARCHSTSKKTMRGGGHAQFLLEKVELGHDEDGRQVTSCICQAVSERDRIRREEELRGMRMSIALEVFMKAFFETEKRYGMPVFSPHLRRAAQCPLSGRVGRP